MKEGWMGRRRYFKITLAISSGHDSGVFVGMCPVDLWPVTSEVLDAGWVFLETVSYLKYSV